MSARVKFVCFTFNNYSDDDYLKTQLLAKEHCSYMTIGKETGDSGTPHLQGYMELNKRMRLKSVTKMFHEATGKVVYTAKRIGTGAQAAQYCQKEDDDYWEHGTLSKIKVGQRTDIEKVRDEIKSGIIKSEWDLLNTVTSMQAYRFGSVFINNMPVDPTRDPPLIFWLHGATGTGKSRSAAKFIGDVVARRGWQYWRANQGLAWFDGYHRQEIAWFDDYRFSGKKTDYALLLNVTDRYPLRVPIKGGFVGWCPRIIIFTGPTSIQRSFMDLSAEDGVDQFRRRVSSEHDFNAGGQRLFEEQICRFLTDEQSVAPPREDPTTMVFDPDGIDITDDEMDYDSSDMIVDADSDDEGWNEEIMNELNNFRTIDDVGAEETKT